MKTLVKPKDMKIKILGAQSVNGKKTYRPFFYVKKVKTSNGILLFNLITFELIFLRDEETESFKKTVCPDNRSVKSLIEKWFLVPEETDDLKLVKQLENMLVLTNKSSYITSYSTFTILPTTDCNARCFYCFEHGVKKKTMSEQTATDVADFILKNKFGKKIYLRWFGGEPLYNSKAMDIICRKLTDRNTDFESSIITNGYLFDDEMIKKAVNLWRIKKVQITLDGTEKKYNRIKNYIYTDKNAYLRVIGNIEKLLLTDTEVKIRLNMDSHNEEDLNQLVRELYERFGDYSNLTITPRLLIDESCARMKNRDEREWQITVTKQIKLEEYISANFKKKGKLKLYNNSQGHCIADNDSTVLITPDGKLGKCESIVDRNYIGDIYSGVTDIKMLNWYKDVKTSSENCDECFFRPCCVYPKCCINTVNNCTEVDKKIIDTRLSNQMLKCYEKFKHENI